jgi:hypothetical protein
MPALFELLEGEAEPKYEAYYGIYICIYSFL